MKSSEIACQNGNARSDIYVHVPGKALRHGGFNVEALSGLLHGFGSSGGANRRGGDAANGMPKKVFTATSEPFESIVVVVPTTGPSATSTLG